MTATDVFSLLVLGALGGLIALHLSLAIALRTRTHGEFPFLILGLALCLVSLNPTLSAELRVLGEQATSGRMIPIGMALVGLFGSLLTRSTLQRSKRDDILNRFMTGSAALFGAALVLLWLIPPPVGIAIVSIAVPLFCGLVVVCGTQAMRVGMRGAGLYVLGWAVLLLGALFYAAKVQAWLPISFASMAMLQVATLIAVLLIACALILRSVESDTPAARSMQRTLAEQTHLIEALRESEETMAARLAERSAALEQAHLQLKKNREDAEHATNHDALTGLVNRMLLEDRAAHGMLRARRHNTRLALLLINLEQFKTINQRYGHSCGDQLLSEVGKRLLAAVRAQDTVARIGGDEFAIVLEEVFQHEDAERVSATIMKQFEQAFVIDNQAIMLGAAIGCAFFPEDGKDPAHLLKSAAKQIHNGRSVGSGTVTDTATSTAR